MQEKYEADGFKFDAGDIGHYNDPELEFYDKSATSVDMCRYWAKIGLDFPFNEYRAGWKMGGEALVQRLGDKDYSWNAVGLLIPDMIAAGICLCLSGYDRRRPVRLFPGSRPDEARSRADRAFLPGTCLDADDAILGGSLAHPR